MICTCNAIDNQKIIVMKNLLKLNSLIVLALIVLSGTTFVFNSCNNDNDDGDLPEISPLAGKYTFKSATLTSPLTLLEGVSFPTGFNMTSFVEQGLFSATPCVDKSNTRIELRESMELFYVCDGEANELKVGTWSTSTDMAQLNLNLSSPPLPSDMPLALKALVVNVTGLSGNIENLPIPITIFADLIPDGVDISQLPQAVIANIAIIFDKVN